MGDDDDDDNDDDGRRRRSPFPLSRFESTEDDDVNDDAAEATPNIPIGGRFYGRAKREIGRDWVEETSRA